MAVLTLQEIGMKQNLQKEEMTVNGYIYSLLFLLLILKFLGIKELLLLSKYLKFIWICKKPTREYFLRNNSLNKEKKIYR